MEFNARCVRDNVGAEAWSGVVWRFILLADEVCVG